MRFELICICAHSYACGDWPKTHMHMSYAYVFWPIPECVEFHHSLNSICTFS